MRERRLVWSFLRQNAHMERNCTTIIVCFGIKMDTFHDIYTFPALRSKVL